MTIAKTHTGTVITKDGPQLKLLHENVLYVGCRENGVLQERHG